MSGPEGCEQFCPVLREMVLQSDCERPDVAGEQEGGAGGTREAPHSPPHNTLIGFFRKHSSQYYSQNYILPSVLQYFSQYHSTVSTLVSNSRWFIC